MPPAVKKEYTATNLVGAISGDRYNMNSAIASQPTSEMRAELVQAGVAIPAEDDLTKLSSMYNTWIEEFRHLNGQDKAVTWFNLFEVVDQDGSGYITYDELVTVTRQKLRKTAKAMPEQDLKALWCALDADDSNAVHKDEMSGFLRRGAPAVEKAPKTVTKEYSSANLVGAISGDRYNMNVAIASQPTAEMRAELAEAGYSLPTDEALAELSVKMNMWLEQKRHDEGKAEATTWFNLFSEVDQDGSGYITFDELTNIIRRTLKKDTSVLSEKALKGLWCSLDDDDSNSVQKDEMAAFFRLGGIVKKKKAPKAVNKDYSSANLVGAISGDRYNMSAAIASQPTAEMRAELAEAGYSLPTDEELTELSKSMNTWLEEMRHLEGKYQATTWFQLFAEVDVDGSGYITFDELTTIIRRKLKKDAKVMSEKALKALWCALDEDDSNAVQKDEMAAFFKRGMSGHGVNKADRKMVEKEYSSANLVGAISGDRINMNSALASQPTVEMRAELEKQGVKVPEGNQLKEISKKLNAWLEEFRHLDGKYAATTWFNLFAEVDQDGSGYVTFDELTNVFRQKLRKDAKAFPTKNIKALWCALDVDDSNQIHKDEMASFFKLGMPKDGVNKGAKKVAKKEHSASNLVGLISGSSYNMGVALASQPTKEMREELEKANVAVPADAELVQLSKKLNKWLEERRDLEGRGSTLSWFNLFTEVDLDGSGYITFDELTTIIRRKLKKDAKTFPTKSIKALWCALDADDSNQVHKDEMAAFFKLGADAIRKGKQKAISKEYSAKSMLGSISGDRVGIGGALASTPTKEMREELMSKGIALPNDSEQIALSKKFNSWLEASRYDQGKAKSTTWFNLFTEVDEDQSGFITFDEVRRVVRQKLRINASTLADNAIKALWVVLDVDDSNQITKDEFANFLKGIPAKPREEKEAGAKEYLSSFKPKLYDLETGKELPSKAQMEEARRKARSEAKAWYALREERKKEMIRETAARDAQKKRMMEVARLEHKRKMDRATLLTQYKRSLLNQMCNSMIASPIPLDNGGRIGGGRVVPLYQSERIIVEMERKGSQMQWPRSRPVSPHQSHPSMFLDEVSRLDDLTTPSWIERMSRVPSRAASSKGSRPVGAFTPSGNRPPMRATTPQSGMRVSASLPAL